MWVKRCKIENIGMKTLAIADVMVTVAMKSMHSSSINTKHIEDIKDFIIE